MKMNGNVVLADTSAWIETFKIKGNRGIIDRMEILIKEGKLVTVGIVIFEILKGVSSTKEYEMLEEKLRYFKCLEFKDEYWRKSSLLAYKLYRSGFKISSNDIFISIVAIESQCDIIHFDKHFDIIARYSPLKIYS